MLETKENAMSTKTATKEPVPGNGSKAQAPAPASAPTPSQPVPAAAHGHATPFTMIRRFAEEMDRLFEDFGMGMGLHAPKLLTRGHELLRREAGMIPAEWSPRIDVRQAEGKLCVRADLPGLARDDIKVEITRDALTIHGERKTESKKEEHHGYFYNECSYGSFYRSIPLPDGADTANASADFHNGVLEVTIPTPNKPSEKVRRLEIRSGK
jgi:HSP20 family protein